MILEEGSVSFPDCFCQSLHHFTGKKNWVMGTQRAPGRFIWRDSLGFKENSSRWGGGECCFHTGNLLTREQQNILAVIVPFKWRDSSAGRRFTSNEDVSPQAWQQHNTQSIQPKFQTHISRQLQEATSYLHRDYPARSFRCCRRGK